MKTAAIILMYIGLFALVNDSQAANSDDVWKTLWEATDRTVRVQPHKNFDILLISKDKLVTDLVKKGWGVPREGLTAAQAVAKIGVRENLLFSRGEWDAMIKIEAFIHANNLGDVWSLLPKVDETVSREVLAKFLIDNKWDNVTQRMTADNAAGYFTGTGSFINKDVWTAMIEIAKFIREAP